jgi:hypothetical protein
MVDPLDHLCWYDPRRKDYLDRGGEYDDTPPRGGEDGRCFCDPCSSGRDALALALLEAREEITRLTEGGKVKRLSEKQIHLLALVAANEGSTTSELATARDDRQVYESHLRDRLFRLYARGLVNATEKTGKGGWVVRREWRTTTAGRAALQGTALNGAR